ncbi:general secretion pathway protein GspB [bacterium]|nr:general secretion pathway protein GspB [bacterium]
MGGLTGDKKRMMVLGGLALVLVVVVIVKVLPSVGSSSSAHAAVEGANRSVLDRDPKHLECVARIARIRVPKEYAGDDVRDPTEPLVRVATTKTSSESKSQPAKPAPVRLPDMTLYGIIWDPETPMAMIDGVDVRIGDRIKGARVTEIGIDRVVFVYRSERFELTVD